jgi:small nuclear ribonucleoprotein (snRNP)-like protein
MNPSPSSRGGRVEGGSGGRGRGRGGGGDRKPQSTGDAAPLVLPKEVLMRCVGVPVLVSLKGGSSTGGDDAFCAHELSGTLQQFDEDCNLLLTEVVHYELRIPVGGAEEGAPSPSWKVVRQCRKAMVGGDRVAQVVPNPIMESFLRLEAPAVDTTTAPPPTL